MKSRLVAATASLIALFVGAQPAQALEEQIKNFRGIRSSAMGGIVTTTGNFAEALFANPARLSAVAVSRWDFFDLTLEGNTNLMTDASTLGKTFGASGADVIANASKIIGRNQHIRAQVFMGHFNPHFIGDLGMGLGLLASAQSNILVNYTTDIDAQVITDTGPALGFSHPFFGKRLLVGASVRMLYRAGFDERINSLEFLSGKEFKLKTFGRQGIGIDGDIGAYYRIPWDPSFMRVAIGGTANNLLKSHYDDVRADVMANVASRPLNNDRTASLGMRFDFPDTGLMKAPLMAIELQDIGSTTHQMSFFKKLHIGGETRLSRVFSFRGGLNQGYLSGGIGIDLPVLKVDLATYGEELSSNTGAQEDRRFMLRLAFEI